MPVTVQILKAHGLVVVRSTGVLKVTEHAESFQYYVQHSDFAPGQRFLIDMRQVTKFDGDYLGAMKHLAMMNADIPRVETSVLFVYLADTDISKKLSQIGINALTATKEIVACVTETEQEALDILGLPGINLNTLQAETLLFQT